MTKHLAKNERIKRSYLGYLKDAKRMDTSSVDMAAAAISHFDQWNNCRDFAKFHIEQARAYKAHLAQQTNAATGKPLAKSTIYARLMAVKTFFVWLAGQPGYKSRISYPDCDYFNPSANDARVATARREKRVPTIEQVRHVLSHMPAGNDIEMRDRAIVAFTLLTGARDSAIASFKLRHINLEQGKVSQDGREVRTKGAKTFTSVFFPVGDDIRVIVAEWIEHLSSVLLFGPDDPLFPATRVDIKDGLFHAAGLSRDHWTSATPIRKVFRSAFEAAGLPYSNPHSLRDTLAMLGEKRCRTPEEFKAWSQNLGHEHVLTTFTSYGTVSAGRQAEIISGFEHGARDSEGNDEKLEAIMALVRTLKTNA